MGDQAIEVKTVEAGSPLMAEAFALRTAVFVVEQKVPPELELDALDAEATHLVAICQGCVVGTLRLLQDHGAAKVGRVAVSATSRRRGVGRWLMERAEAISAGRGFREVVLHAQVAVVPFYRRLGYIEEGDQFDDAGIPHIAMRKKIA